MSSSRATGHATALITRWTDLFSGWRLAFGFFWSHLVLLPSDAAHHGNWMEPSGRGKKVALEFVVADLCRAVAIRIGSAVDMDGVPEACHNLDHGLVLVDRGHAKSSGQIAEK